MNMSLTEIQKDVSFMRQNVMRWKREARDPETLKLIGDFLLTYKALKTKLDTPISDYAYMGENGAENKKERVKPLYSELQNWHEAIYQSMISERDAAEKEQAQEERVAHERAVMLAESMKEGTEIKNPEPDPFIVDDSNPGQVELKLPRGGRREGAGRKKSEYAVRKVSLALLPERWEQIDKVLERRKKLTPNMTQSDLLRDMLEFAFNRGG